MLTGSQVVYFDSHKDAAAGRSPKCVVKLTDISEVGEVTDGLARLWPTDQICPGKTGGRNAGDCHHGS